MPPRSPQSLLQCCTWWPSGPHAEFHAAAGLPYARRRRHSCSQGRGNDLADERARRRYGVEPARVLTTSFIAMRPTKNPAEAGFAWGSDRHKPAPPGVDLAAGRHGDLEPAEGRPRHHEHDAGRRAQAHARDRIAPGVWHAGERGGAAVPDEALVLSTLGGLVGVPYAFDPAINLLSMLFSAAIGVEFGYFPARHAARMRRSRRCGRSESQPQPLSARTARNGWSAASGRAWHRRRSTRPAGCGRRRLRRSGRRRAARRTR